MKKTLKRTILAMALATLMAVGILSVTVLADDVNDGNQATVQSVEWEFVSKTHTLIIYSGIMSDYDQSNPAPWKSIDDHSPIEIVVIYAQNIGNYAFYGLNCLTSVTIDNSVTSIGNYAFSGCSHLENVIIPDSVTNIGVGAFLGCGEQMSVTIPSSVTNIGGGAFASCKSITVSPKNIAYDSRDNCNAIVRTSTNELVVGCRNTVIPSGVTGIGDYAFKNCSGLTEVTIPSGATSIGNYAFSNCNGLQSIDIPSSVTNIGDDAFSNCSGLTVVTIPSGMTGIGAGAFNGCNGITDLTMPAGATYLTNTFEGCTGITSVTLTGNGPMCNYDSSTYEYTPWYQSRTNFLAITIEEGVTSIGKYAFYGCDGSMELSMGNSMASIGYAAFNGCVGLSDVYYAGSPADRQRIKINTYNSCILQATWHYALCDHSKTHVDYKAPTYTAPGNTEYWYCTSCKKYFSDEACTVETTLDQTVIPKKDIPSIEGKFSDVSKNDWFYDSVAFVNATGIMTGMGGTNNFAPYDPLHREQLAVMLYRLENSPYTEYIDIFPDVPAGNWYTLPIIWGYRNGIISGYQNGYFGVGDNITREQLAVILYRYAAKYKHLDVSEKGDISDFTDAASVSSWAYNAIRWAVGNEIITGKDGGTRIDPQGNAARCECAAMFQRFMNKYGL